MKKKIYIYFDFSGQKSTKSVDCEPGMGSPGKGSSQSAHRCRSNILFRPTSEKYYRTQSAYRTACSTTWWSSQSRYPTVWLTTRDKNWILILSPSGCKSILSHNVTFRILYECQRQRPPCRHINVVWINFDTVHFRHHNITLHSAGFRPMSPSVGQVDTISVICLNGKNAGQ